MTLGKDMRGKGIEEVKGNVRVTVHRKAVGHSV
jgi:hypothetical protein